MRRRKGVLYFCQFFGRFFFQWSKMIVNYFLEFICAKRSFCLFGENEDSQGSLLRIQVFQESFFLLKKFKIGWKN
jgi:hypothetical protein